MALGKLYELGGDLIQQSPEGLQRPIILGHAVFTPLVGLFDLAIGTSAAFLSFFSSDFTKRAYVHLDATGEMFSLAYVATTTALCKTPPINALSHFTKMDGLISHLSKKLFNHLLQQPLVQDFPLLTAVLSIAKGISSLLTRTLDAIIGIALALFALPATLIIKNLVPRGSDISYYIGELNALTLQGLRATRVFFDAYEALHTAITK